MTQITMPYRRGQGCLNAFIIFDLRFAPDRYTESFVKAAHKLLVQVGDDDVLILRAGPSPTSLFMDVLEPDGSFAAFCGNGARVIAAYLESLEGPGHYAIVAGDTTRSITAHGGGRYSVEMGQTLFNPEESEFVQEADRFTTKNNTLWHIQIEELPSITWYFSQTGEPHLISFDKVSNEQLRDLGLIVNSEHYRDLFPQGINLNVAQKLSNNQISNITFERGVNRITQACGTGSTCSVMVASQCNQVNSPSIIVKTMGGEMTITYDRSLLTSVMSGPAELDSQIYEIIFKEEPL